MTSRNTRRSESVESEEPTELFSSVHNTFADFVQPNQVQAEHTFPNPSPQERTLDTRSEPSGSSDQHSGSENLTLVGSQSSPDGEPITRVDETLLTISSDSVGETKNCSISFG